MDDLDHPDLHEIDRELRRRMEAVLWSEQAAAAVAARRSTSLWGRLIEAEDAGEVLSVKSGGTSHEGQLVSVGSDFVEIDTSPPVLISINHIEYVEVVGR